MGAFCGAGSGMGDGGLTGGDVRGSMKRRLRRYVRPSSVCTRYDLGVLLGVMTWAGVHLSSFESWTWILSPGCSEGNWCAVRSWYIFCVSLCLLPSGDDFGGIDGHGSQVFGSRWQNGSELSAHQ